MQIKINILEVASELAHKELEKLWLRDAVGQMYDEEEESYTEEAQDLFNDLYDHYYNFLLNLEEK